LKILINIPIDRYNNLLMASVPFRSTYLEMLKSGLVIRDSERREAAEILCDIDQAKGLRELASQICPYAGLDIEESIRLLRET
jgi:hypothetical protein